MADQLGLIEVWRSDRPLDPLDHYIEAHVHGGISIPGDVEALVLDPSFRASRIDEMARAAGLRVESRLPKVLWSGAEQVSGSTVREG